jgi:hypothetical protein
VVAELTGDGATEEQILRHALRTAAAPAPAPPPTATEAR